MLTSQVTLQVTSQVLAAREATRQKNAKNAKKSMLPCLRQGGSRFLTFAFLALVVVPFLVFALSALLTLPMWGIECYDAHATYHTELDLYLSNLATNATAGRRLTSRASSGSSSNPLGGGSGASASTPAGDGSAGSSGGVGGATMPAEDTYTLTTAAGDQVDLHAMCSYFEWFLYICGNLLGVQLTLVAPIAGHALPEILDLLISTWSLSLTGLAVGLVGGLSFVTRAVDNINETSERLGLSPQDRLHMKVQEDVTSGRLIDLERFVNMMRDTEGRSDDELREVFKRLDTDGDNAVTTTELEQYLSGQLKKGGRGSKQAMKKIQPQKETLYSLRVELKAELASLQQAHTRLEAQQGEILAALEGLTRALRTQNEMAPTRPGDSQPPPPPPPPSTMCSAAPPTARRSSPSYVPLDTPDVHKPAPTTSPQFVWLVHAEEQATHEATMAEEIESTRAELADLRQGGGALGSVAIVDRRSYALPAMPAGVSKDSSCRSDGGEFAPVDPVEGRIKVAATDDNETEENALWAVTRTVSTFVTSMLTPREKTPVEMSEVLTSHEATEPPAPPSATRFNLDEDDDDDDDEVEEELELPRQGHPSRMVRARKANAAKGRVPMTRVPQTHAPALAPAP